MTPWQKRARAFVAVVAVCVIGVVAYTIRPRESAPPPAPIERLDPKAKIETQGGDVVQLKGEKRNLRVEFQGQVTYENGQTVLRDVKVLAENRGGRNYTITGTEAQVGKDESSFEITGSVRLETDDGLVVNSDQATYADAEKIVRAPGPVTFSRRRMTGKGIGFTFDEQRDVLQILDQAEVHFAPEGAEGPMDVTAGTYIHARRDRYMRFERNAHMDRAGQIIDAAEGTVRMWPDRDETQTIELRGGSRVQGGGQMGALRTMAARDMNLTYAEDGRTLTDALLAGSGQIDLVTKSGVSGQRLAGEFIEIGLQPDGSVRSLAARDAVTVTLPATKDTAARTIRSTSLTAAGTADGLREMKFREGVEYQEAATKAHGARTAKSRSLDASLDPASATLVEARFTGNFEFTDGDMRARSADAVYNLAKSMLALRGTDVAPHIDDRTMRLDADQIDVTLDPRRLAAVGRVRNTMLPSTAAPDQPAVKRPALLGDKEPVQMVAEKLTYDETTRRAEYAGQVRLLQGETTITADTLTLDETKGDLLANGRVVTHLSIAEKDADASAPAKPTVARAGSFTYADATRQATYRTNAQLDGDQGNLRATTIELQLATGENTLDGLVADGQVTALVDKRTVTGSHLTYSPGDDKYVVVGAPVKMIDADCQETSGKTLTFWKASDRVQVDGNDEVRTQTKGGAKCPPGPPY